jgi:hypothetical protein
MMARDFFSDLSKPEDQAWWRVHSPAWIKRILFVHLTLSWNGAYEPSPDVFSLNLNEDWANQITWISDSRSMRLIGHRIGLGNPTGCQGLKEQGSSMMAMARKFEDKEPAEENNHESDFEEVQKSSLRCTTFS